jgi:hypothetical protein
MLQKNTFYMKDLDLIEGYTFPYIKVYLFNIMWKNMIFYRGIGPNS